MKNIIIIFLYGLTCSFLFIACNNNSTEQNSTSSTPVSNPSVIPSTSPIVNPLDTTNYSNNQTQTQTQPINPSQNQSAPLEVSTNGSAVKHYICPNNCAGSGGDQQVNCPVCNTQYVHNDKFHQQPGQQNVQTQPTTTAQQAVAPATNTKGVYHYICDKGCPGGSGIRENCAKCGTLLSHNQSYHDDGSK